MSSPKFMVFKLKDLRIPALIFAVIVALLIVLFYRNKTAQTFRASAAPSPAPSSTTSSLFSEYPDGKYISKVAYSPGGTMNVIVDVRSSSIVGVSIDHIMAPTIELSDAILKNLESVNNYVITSQSIEFDSNYTPNNIELLLMDGIKNALSTDLLPDLHYTYAAASVETNNDYDTSDLFVD